MVRAPASAVVIGAGLAGLVAAHRLSRAGSEVSVLEARDRVGGRTWSRRLDNGAVIEMGAEFILDGNTAVPELADELGLELWDKGMRYGNREPRGGIGTTAEQLAAGVREVDLALSALAGSAISVRELLDRLEIEPGTREAVLARAEISSASSADEIPASDLAGLAHIDTNPAPSVAGGNQTLALALAARLGDAVRLADPVARVTWWRSGVEVETATGAQVAADAAIVAVPASVIDRVEFEPELPEAKRDAFARVRYGHAAKLFVPLGEAAPVGAVMNVPDRYWCWTATGAGDQPMPVVSCFAGSPAALERLEVAAGPERWIESLAALRPDLALEPDGAVLCDWDADPWIAAAYSIWPDPEVVGAIAEPVGPLAFAGEHLGGAFNGLMEGAIRTGRAAAEVLSRN